MSNARIPSKTAMRVSAIRFGADLWRLLEAEAARAGVSVSQYVREAALARASAAVAARGEDALEALGRVAEGAAPVSRPSEPQTHSTREELRTPRRSDEPLVSSARNVRSQAQEVRSGAQAVRAQSRQISRRARQIARKPQSDDD